MPETHSEHYIPSLPFAAREKAKGISKESALWSVKLENVYFHECFTKSLLYYISLRRSFERSFLQTSRVELDLADQTTFLPSGSLQSVHAPRFFAIATHETLHATLNEKWLIPMLRPIVWYQPVNKASVISKFWNAVWKLAESKFSFRVNPENSVETKGPMRNLDIQYCSYCSCL